MKLKTWLHIVWGFAVFNIVLGVTLVFYYPHIPFTVISPVIPQIVWALLFFTSGVMMTYGIIRHNLRLLWYLMVGGLFLKAIWEFGLFFRIFSGGTILWTEIWGLVFYIQFLAVIYFNRNAIV